jgi:hypothetical protein
MGSGGMTRRFLAPEDAITLEGQIDGQRRFTWLNFPEGPYPASESTRNFNGLGVTQPRAFRPVPKTILCTTPNALRADG